MCLIACYWAQIPRVVYAATSYDCATYGFEDLQFYREFTRRTSNGPSRRTPLTESCVRRRLRPAHLGRSASLPRGTQILSAR